MPEFDLIVSQSMAHALEVLASHGGAMPVAGATDLIPLVRSGRWRTSLAVDITRLAELRYIRPGPDGLEIGALTTHDELLRSPLVLKHAPVLAEAASWVAGPQVRARGTLGGNICTASPAGDTLPALYVLEAQVRLISRDSLERHLPLSEFITGPGQTARRPGELLAGVLIPPLPRLGEGVGMAFDKVGKRKALIISIVNAAALLVVDGPRIGEARLALGAVAPTVVRCTEAERFLTGQAPSDELFHQAAARVADTVRPIDDVRASAAYRRAAAVGLARRTLVRACPSSVAPLRTEQRWPSAGRIPPAGEVSGA